MAKGISRRIVSRRIWGKVGTILVLAVFTVLLAFPFYWMLITSFKQNVDLYTMENNPFIFNAKPTLEHLKFLVYRNQIRPLAWATPRSSVSSSSP